jgi:hypothetical protein
MKSKSVSKKVQEEKEENRVFGLASLAGGRFLYEADIP